MYLWLVIGKCLPNRTAFPFWWDFSDRIKSALSAASSGCPQWSLVRTRPLTAEAGICSVPGRATKIGKTQGKAQKKECSIQWWEPLSTDCLLTRYSSQLISPPLALPSPGTRGLTVVKTPLPGARSPTVPSGKEAQVSVSPRITWSAGVAGSP